MSPGAIALYGLLLASGPALSDDPSEVSNFSSDASTTSPVAGAASPEGGMRTASGDSAGTAASPRPFLPPARTPLYERPVEWMWWVLWWLPEHWRGEMITFLAAQVMALLGFLATRAGLHGEDPSRYPRLLRPVVAAFADRSAAAHVADEEEVVSLRQEVATLTRQMATLKRSLREQEQARAAMEERVKALNVKPTLTEAQRAEMEALLRDLLAALGET